jgi:hypothetical protein
VLEIKRPELFTLEFENVEEIEKKLKNLNLLDLHAKLSLSHYNLFEVR